VLATARRAVYPLQSVLKLPEARQKRFFQRGTGRQEGRARVRRAVAVDLPGPPGIEVVKVLVPGFLLSELL